MVAASQARRERESRPPADHREETDTTYDEGGRETKKHCQLHASITLISFTEHNDIESPLPSLPHDHNDLSPLGIISTLAGSPARGCAVGSSSVLLASRALTLLLSILISSAFSASCSSFSASYASLSTSLSSLSWIVDRKLSTIAAVCMGLLKLVGVSKDAS